MHPVPHKRHLDLHMITGERAASKAEQSLAPLPHTRTDAHTALTYTVTDAMPSKSSTAESQSLQKGPLTRPGLDQQRIYHAYTQTPTLTFTPTPTTRGAGRAALIGGVAAHSSHNPPCNPHTTSTQPIPTPTTRGAGRAALIGGMAASIGQSWRRWQRSPARRKVASGGPGAKPGAGATAVGDRGAGGGGAGVEMWGHASERGRVSTL
eukprot:187896-Chlamydomonas_euryale.AAC.1